MKRHIPIKGSYNIRDIGGYKTKNGGTIKWRKLFRSALLTHIDLSDTEKMEALHICSICDFRTLDEQANGPDIWSNLENIKKYPLPIGHGRVDKFKEAKPEDFLEGEGHYLYKANQSYVNAHAHQFKAFFEILLDESTYPILYHCTAGKDRTGFATYLLLSLLGVDEKVILEDYLLTNVYLDDFATKISKIISKDVGIDHALIKTVFQAKASFLKGATDAIKSNYGTVDVFIKKELGIGVAEEQKLFEILVE